MKICSNRGSTATADAPSTRSSVGTSPPAEHLLALFADDRLEQRANLLAGRFRMREKNEPGAVAAGGRQREAEGRRHLAQKPVRHLHEDAGAVAGRRLAAAGAAMQEVDQDAQPLLDNGVRTAALDVDDEADAAGIVLVRRVVQAGGRGAIPAGCRPGDPGAASGPFLRKAGFRPLTEGRGISGRHGFTGPGSASAEKTEETYLCPSRTQK